MAVRLFTTESDLQLYDAWIRSSPQGTLWQSLEWKNLQEALGREVKIYADTDGDAIAASALVVIDTTKGGLSTWEIPRGSVGVAGDELRVTGLLNQIVHDAKESGAISIYLTPASPLETRNSKLVTRNSQRFVHPEATRLIDLTQSEEQILEQMKQKGRYNIRLAEKNGVTVEQSAAVDYFAALMDETAKRDGFRATGARTYRAFLRHAPGAFLLLAYAQGAGEQGKDTIRPIAGLLGAIWGQTSLYYYGASDHAHRELMAPYLLQWEAMRFCKAQGCTQYDFFGVTPDGAIEHPWAGVSEFKAKFGGTVITYPPEQEIVLRPFVKKLLGMKRAILG